MGNHNITPIVTLRHHRNILITIDVAPGISIIDIVIVCTGGRGTDATEADGRGVDACGSGTSATRSMESLSGRRRGEPIC